jgi:hypothetical protein
MEQALIQRRFTVSNSLTELNQYANTSVVYTDDRQYSITFSANATSNTSTTIDEDQSFVVPTGIDIVDVLSQPGNITYNVNAGTAGNVIGVWPTLPYWISNTSSGNTFRITGTFDGATWDTVKNITLTFPDLEANVSFTANIQYPDPANVANTAVLSWNNSLTIANTNPEYTFTTAYNFAEDSSTTMVYNIQDIDATATFTLTFDQYSGNLGIFTVNGISAGIGNTAVITGNRATVNAANVTFYPYPDSTNNVGVYFSAVKTNPFGNVAFATNVISTLTCTSTHDEYNFATTGTYDEDTLKDFSNLISDQDALATSYSISLQQTSGNTGTWIVNGTTYGNATTALVLSNTKANINSANIKYQPLIDYTGNIAITYNQSKVNSLFGNIVQAANIIGTYTVANTNSEIGNLIGVSRSYTSNTVNNIFATTTPYISDGPDSGQMYTITLTSSLGKFGNSSANAISASSYSFTGNTTLVNSEFSNMKFVPNYGAFAGNGTFSYTQVRNGITQVNTTETLTGTENTLSSITKTYITSTTDKTLTPTFEQSYWQRADILLVGGGGGGGGDSGPSAFGSGGGGAGQVRTFSNIQLPNELITITVGSGGAGASNGNGTNGGSSAYTSSSIGSVTSVGGQGGKTALTGGQGGTSGNGYLGGQNGPQAGGGGGGAGGVGSDGVGYVKGSGGPGIFSTISGSNVEYGIGGQGGNLTSLGITSSTYGGGGGGGRQNDPGDGLTGTAGIVIIKIT